MLLGSLVVVAGLDNRIDEDGSSIRLPARSESLFRGLVVVPQLRNASSRRQIK